MATTPVLPRDLDRLAREEGVTLRTLLEAIPEECWELQPWKAWGGLLRNLALIAVFQVALTYVTLRADASLAWTIPAALALWCLTAWAMGGVFLVGHDCGHMAFSRRRWVNVWVGHLCMSFFYASFHGWRLGHNKHHVHTNLRKQDTNWAENMVTVEEYRALPWSKKLETILGFGTPVGPLVGNWVGQTRFFLMPWAIPQLKLNSSDRRALLTSALVTLVCTGGLVTSLLYFFGVGVMLKHYLVPVVIGFATAALFTLLHHMNEDALVFDEADWTPFRGQVLSTFDVRFPWIVEVLCMYITLHLVHHLTTAIPWYHLRRASAAIKARHPAYYQERRLSLRYLWRLWSRPLLVRDERGFYTMAPRAAAATAPASAPPPAPTPTTTPTS